MPTPLVMITVLRYNHYVTQTYRFHLFKHRFLGLR